MTSWIIGGLLSLMLSFALTYLAIQILRQRLIDTPNERSSHTIPTPRGGGIAIGLSVFISSLILSVVTKDDIPWVWMLAPLSMAALGFLDDALNLGIRIRFSAQFIAAGIISSYAVWLAELPISWAVFGALFLTVALTWLTNLYNFMDGINGIAAIEAITVTLSMALTLYSINNLEFIPLLLLIGGAATGFLYWNFPRASIFMGDVGSLYLGFGLGAIAIASSLENITIAIAWLIMLSVFITDATWTLLRRLFSGQRFWQAHRLHAYQKLAAARQSHTATSLWVGCYNLAWCLPLAYGVVQNLIPAWAGLFLAYAPMIAVATTLKAGKP